MGCQLSVNVNGKGPAPIEQPTPSATGKGAVVSGGSETGGPVRLVVNATSNSEVSSNPILGDGPPGAAVAARRRPTTDFYKGPVPPLNEVERMLAFSALDLDKRPADPITARLCHVLAKSLKVVCVNLHFINEGVFHINTSQMADAYNASCSPDVMNRKMSLCGWTLLPQFPEVLIVPDLLQDVPVHHDRGAVLHQLHHHINKFREHPIIKGEPHFRFYGGCPLVTFEGFRLGTVCMLDVAPRVLTVQEVNMLCNFAELAVRELERKQVAEVVGKGSDATLPDKAAASDFFSEGVMIVDTVQDKEWPVVWMNSVCSQLIGVSEEQAYGGPSGERTMGDFFENMGNTEEETKEQIAQVVAAIKEGGEVSLAACKCKYYTKTGCLETVDLHFRPVTSDKVDDLMPLIGIPSFIKPADTGAPASTLYLVSIRPCSAAAGQPEGAADAQAEDKAAFTKLHTTMTRSQPSALGSLEGVQLGQFIANAQTGRLFRGTFDGRPVVIKVIEHSGQGEEPQEAMMLSGLSHPNIVATYKIVSRTRTTGRSQLRRYKAKKQMVVPDEAASQATKPSSLLEFWLVREWCEKGSLSDAVERGWFMTEDSLVASAPAPDMFAVYATAHDIASAMAYLHSQGIVHGNLHGDNLGLAKSSQDQRGFVVKVTDFDVAVKAGDERVPCSMTSPSFAHLAPEVITDQMVSKASDVYAFGVVLWELLMGEPAWNGLSAKDVAANVVMKKMQLPFPDYEATPYKDLALQCMANDAQARPSFAAVLARMDQLRSNVQAGPGRAFLREGFTTSVPALATGTAVAAATAAAAGSVIATRAAGSDAAQPDAAQPDAAQPDSAQPDLAQPDAAKPDAQPDPAQPDPAQPDPAQPDAAQTDPAQPDPAQTDAAQPDAAQPEGVEPDMQNAAEPEAAETGPDPGEPGSAEAGAQDTADAGSAEPEAAEPESTQDDAAQPESVQSDATNSQPAQLEVESAAEPEAAAQSEADEPDAAEAVAAEPGAEPEAAEPAAAQSKAAEPEAAEPDVVQSGAQETAESALASEADSVPATAGSEAAPDPAYSAPDGSAPEAASEIAGDPDSAAAPES